jgi:hypothetical protein
VIRRTNLSDVVLPFLAVGVICYLLLQLSYESLPPFQWFTAVPIAALAIAEFVMAGRVRAAVRHSADARPMTALAIARAVALGKASVLVGAAVAGASVALIAKVLPDANRTSAAQHDLEVGLSLLVVAIALAVAGLVLERAGINPNHDRS